MIKKNIEKEGSNRDNLIGVYWKLISISMMCWNEVSPKSVFPPEPDLESSLLCAQQQGEGPLL